MRVLIYAGGFSSIGGIETFIHALATTLMSKQHHQVRLVCWSKQNNLLRDLLQKNVSIKRHPLRWGCRLRIPDLISLKHGIGEINHHDIIVFTKIPPAPVLLLLSRINKNHRPFVYVTPYRPSEMWAGSKPSPELLNLFQTIIVQTDSYIEEMQSYGYTGVLRTIPLVPPAVYPLSVIPRHDRTIRLGFLGRLVPQKNVAYLLQAFSHLVQTDDGPESDRYSWELHLFGDGFKREELEKLTESLGLERHVRFHGAVSYQDVDHAIDSCHLFAFTSITEGQPVASLEILARGRPIVATPVGVFPEMLNSDELGAIAPLGDPRAFAEALARIGTSLMKGQVTPSATQRRFAAMFPREKIVDEYLSLFEALVCRSFTVGSVATEGEI